MVDLAALHTIARTDGADCPTPFVVLPSTSRSLLLTADVMVPQRRVASGDGFEVCFLSENFRGLGFFFFFLNE